MKVWAIIPAKAFDRAKSRLAPVLAPHERETLAEEMFRHALEVCGRSPSVAGLIVVTTSPQVALIAQGVRARVVSDVEGLLGDSIDAALQSLPPDENGAVVLMADLPHLRTDDIEALATALDEAPVVVAPDRVDEGTNALAVCRPLRLKTAFGRRGSFQEHLRRAQEAAAPVLVHRSPSLAFDVDWPEDVALIQRPQTRAAS